MIGMNETDKLVAEWMKDDSKWTTFYNDKFVTVQKMIPFEAKVEREPEFRFKWALDMAIGKNVLDIGCDDGYLCYLLAKKGLEVHGMDVSDKAISEATINCPQGIFVQGFADQSIPYPDNTFDLVTALEIMEHVKDIDKFMTEVFRVLKPNGVFLATTPVGLNYNCVEHVRHWDFYSLEAQVEKVTPTFKIARVFKISEKEVSPNLFAVMAVKL